MSVKKTIRAQFQNIIEGSSLEFKTVSKPKEGWVATMRKALGMSGAQLARRLKVSRSSVSQTEKNEIAGNVTIKHMQNVAKAMDCKFVYAIIPNENVEKIIQDQAEEKATAIIKNTSAHMALENQSLSNIKTKEKIKLQRDELIRNMPSNFWD